MTSGFSPTLGTRPGTTRTPLGSSFLVALLLVLTLLAPATLATTAAPAEATPAAATTLNAPPLPDGFTISQGKAYGDLWLFTLRNWTTGATAYSFTRDQGATWHNGPTPTDGWVLRQDKGAFERVVLDPCNVTPCTPTTARLETLNDTDQPTTVATVDLPADLGRFENTKPRWFDGAFWSFTCLAPAGSVKGQHQVTLLRISETGELTRYSRSDGTCGVSAEIAQSPSGGLEIPRGADSSYTFTDGQLTPASAIAWQKYPSFGLPTPAATPVETRIGKATITATPGNPTIDYGAGPINIGMAPMFVPGTEAPVMLDDKMLMIDRGDGVFVPSYFLNRRPNGLMKTADGLVVWSCLTSNCSSYAMEKLPDAAYLSALPPNATTPMLVTANAVRASASIPPLFEDPLISQAAQNHSNYMMAQRRLSHDEVPGNPGFTGENPGLRCQFVGTSCGGEIASGAGGSNAVFDWLGAPYHGAMMISPTIVVAGASSNASLGNMNFGGTRTLSLRGFGFPQGEWAGALRWSGGEIPDPREKCPPPTGIDFGHPIYYSPARGVTVGALSVTANGEDVPVCTIQSGLYFPMSPLKAATTYTVTVETPGWVTPTDSWSFTTATPPPPPPTPTRPATPTPTKGATAAPTPDPTDDPTLPSPASAPLSLRAAASVGYRAGFVTVTAASATTTTNYRGVRATVRFVRVGRGSKLMAVRQADAWGQVRVTTRVAVPKAHRATARRALAWYAKTWPTIRVTATYGGKSRTVNVRLHRG